MSPKSLAPRSSPSQTIQDPDKHLVHGGRHRLTCVNDLSIKNRFGKYRVKKLDVVDAYELTDCGLTIDDDAFATSSSLERGSAGGAHERNDALVDSQCDPSSAEDGGSSAFSRSCRRCFRTCSVCKPIPRCPPTPASRSSCRRRALHTRRGHRRSLGRSCSPLNLPIAFCRWSSVWKFTNAQLDREIRKMEVTPLDLTLAPSFPGSGDSTRLRNRQSSSCVVSPGTFPTHMTQSDRFAGGLG